MIMQLADTILIVYGFARVLALLCAGGFILAVGLACLRQFTGSNYRWESYRVRLHANTVLISLLLLVLSQSGIWLLSSHAVVYETEAEFQAIFALLLLLGIQASGIWRLLIHFENSISKGVDLLPTMSVSMLRKFQLAASIAAWIAVFTLILTNLFYASPLVQIGIGFVVCLIGIWSLLMVVNDDWINYYLNRRAKKA